MCKMPRGKGLADPTADWRERLSAARLGPSAKRRPLERKHLDVEIRVYAAKSARALHEAFGADANGSHATPASIGDLINATSYVLLKIRNTGSRKQTAVRLTVLGDQIGDCFCQVGEAGSTIKVAKGTSFLIGDIPPKQEQWVHVWAGNPIADGTISMLRRWLQVTVDNPGSVKYSLPMRSKFRFWPAAGRIVAVSLGIAIGVAVVLVALLSYFSLSDGPSE